MKRIEKLRFDFRSFREKLTTRDQEKKENIHFETQITEEKRCITWKIENMDLCPLKMGECHQSPVFTTGKSIASKWALRIYPRGKNVPNSVGIYICKIAPSTRNYVVCELFFGNSIQKLNIHEFKQLCEEEDIEEYGNEKVVSSKALMSEKHVVIECRLVVGYLDSENKIQNDEKGCSTDNCTSNLTRDLKDMYENSKYTDVILQVDKKQFPAHKGILAARSKVFSAMFEHNMKESQTNIVKIEDVEPLVMQNVLFYIYTGKIDDMTFKKAAKMYPAADKYGISGLQKLCSQVMLEKMSVENVCCIISLADMHSETKLKEAANYFFRNYSTQIFETKEWDSLAKDKPLLASQIVRSVVTDYKTKCTLTCQSKS